MKIHERVKLVRTELGLNQVDFSKKICLSQSGYGILEIGNREFKDRHINLICSNCNVNEHWLRTGEGEMFTVSTDNNVNASFGAELTKIILTSDDITKKLILGLSELDEEQLSVVNDLVDLLIKKKQ